MEFAVHQFFKIVKRNDGSQFYDTDTIIDILLDIVDSSKHIRISIADRRVVFSIANNHTTIEEPEAATCLRLLIARIYSLLLPKAENNPYVFSSTLRSKLQRDVDVSASNVLGNVWMQFNLVESASFRPI